VVATNARPPCQHGEHYDYICHHYNLSNIPQGLPLLESQQHIAFYFLFFKFFWKQIEQNSIAKEVWYKPRPGGQAKRDTRGTPYHPKLTPRIKTKAGPANRIERFSKIKTLYTKEGEGG
jgi:hypothetical protein